ncbi:MAG: 4-amino-4-deoxy-L-arabinose transferase-like glycosyltransferase [Planctomycetota bacterium]|jgi:4-amino-4-deoxy-L-arabinose transferase-like glycosyltransferase
MEDVPVAAQDKCDDCGGKLLPGQVVCSPCDLNAKKFANEMKSIGSRIKTVIFGIGLGAVALYFGHLGTWEALETGIQRFDVLSSYGNIADELITREHDPFWFWIPVVVSSLMCVLLIPLAAIIIVSGVTGTGGVGLQGNRPSIRQGARRRSRRVGRHAKNS